KKKSARGLLHPSGARLEVAPTNSVSAHYTCTPGAKNHRASDRRGITWCSAFRNRLRSMHLWSLTSQAGRKHTGGRGAGLRGTGVVGRRAGDGGTLIG